MRLLTRLAALMLSMIFLTAPAHAERGIYRNGTMTVAQPWTSATIAGNDVSAFAVLRNGAMTIDRLLSAHSDQINQIEIVRPVESNGVVNFVPVVGGVAMPAGGALKLAPESAQLRLIGLKTPLIENGQVEITLVLERSGEITVPFEIRPAPPVP